MVPLIHRQARINHAKVTIIAPSSEPRSPNQSRKGKDHRAVVRIAMRKWLTGWTYSTDPSLCAPGRRTLGWGKPLAR